MSAPTRAALAASVGRLHIVAIAALGTFTFGWLFTGHYPWLLAGVTAFDWLLVNLLNRVVALAVLARRTHVRARIPRVFMWLRVPAAGFFFVLLALHRRSLAPLVAYALAFAPPYLAMTAWTSPRSA